MTVTIRLRHYYFVDFFKTLIYFDEVDALCYAGSTVIPERTVDRCTVRHLGSQAVPAANCDIHVCANTTDEV